MGAFFQDNPCLVNWVNAQPLAAPLICLGDGHDGIWNIYTQIGSIAQRREILDWYHLIENLGKVGGSQQRLDAVEAWLWQGDIARAIEQFKDWQHQRVSTFIAYLNKHRARIVKTMVIIKLKASQSVQERLNQRLNRNGTKIS